MAVEQRSPGLVDLEKELVCSICTELLYQPLTLLDCLHTFCGYCLKEWFTVQASRRRSSSSPRFTCPQCRAIVRETRPNATVTTLLDMFLSANPDRIKPAAEKEEIAQKYKPGESVLPTTPSRENSSTESDGDDRRLLEEVREMSLQESRTRTRPSGHRARMSSRSRHADSTDTEGRADDSRSRRRREGERTRRIEHQSSLRSLLSLSDVETMEEEILRQIIEEGLLDGIDLEHLEPGQEEELSERIAEAYRRRHILRSNSQRRQEPREQAQEPTRPRAQSQSVQRPSTAPFPRESSRGPPVSRPHLLEPLSSRSEALGHRRRLSDQGTSRRRTSPTPYNQASSSETVLRPAARSSSDMTSERPRTSQTGRVRTRAPSIPTSRRGTDPDQSISDTWLTGSRERTSQQPIPSRPSISSPTTATHPLSPLTGGAASRGGRSRPSSRSNVNHTPPVLYNEPSVTCDRCGKVGIQYNLYKNCPKCKDGNYNLCIRCYRLGRGCLNWAGFGPTAQAKYKLKDTSNNHLTETSEPAHTLLSFKYQRPPETAYRTVQDGKQLTGDNPARRLQTGLFCDSCQSSANDCFWQCSQCNEGDWGFCNRCVNQGRCCTHALLPIRRIASDNPSTAVEAPPADTSTSHGISSSSPGSNQNESFKALSFSTKCDICTYPIPASTTRFHCLECNDGDYDICANCYLKLVATGKISKANGHNGWRRCLKGHRMVVIGFQDHDEGQRRWIVRDLVGGRALKDAHVQPSSSSCSSSTPTTAGSARAIPSPEIGTGDWSWKEGSERRKKASRLRSAWPSNGPAGNSSNANHTTTTTSSSEASPTSPALPSSPFSRFPPDGGVGLVAVARWAWYPDDDVEDELMFPRGAEITEAENINDDWFWGCYAGLTGLFPGSHVAIVAEVA